MIFKWNAPCTRILLYVGSPISGTVYILKALSSETRQKKRKKTIGGEEETFPPWQTLFGKPKLLQYFDSLGLNEESAMRG